VELPRGITGFRRVDEPQLPTCNPRAFRSHCHTTARALRGRVLRPETPIQSIVTNFFRVTLELPGDPVAVVLNRYYPIVAFVAPPSEHESRRRFVDAPALYDSFRGFGIYEVLTASEAQRPVAEEFCRSLSRTELEPLRYWRPQLIGDVVFNYWD
jgi:hypothetical protein